MQKVLIVEDDSDQLRCITTILKKYEDHFITAAAKNGREAINILKTEDISLVVTDIRMPDIDGILLLAYINTYHPEIPCFVMTAYGTSRLKAKMPKDLLRFFQKPFEVRDLAGAIIAALKEELDDETKKGISPVKIIQLITMDQGTCRIEVDIPENPASMLFFENGILLDAKSGELSGEAAALEILSKFTGSYRIKPFGQNEIPRKIKTNVDELLVSIYGIR